MLEAKTEITPKELKNALDAGEQVALLDVRELHELAICALEYNIHIPMGELVKRQDELKNLKGQNLVVYCRSGGRSGRCADFLRGQGFKNVLNLTGGILAWSDEVDSTVQKY